MCKVKDTLATFTWTPFVEILPIDDSELGVYIKA